MELAGRIGWWLGLSGVFLVVAAVICEKTGAHAVIGGSDVNTHVAATWVLACLGMVLLGNGIALLAYGHGTRATDAE
jgi:hypothetical protein